MTLEGIEGVGKTHAGRAPVDGAAERGIAHVVTREPGGTPLAESIRDLVLTAREEALPATAELLLMFAARAVHLQNLIEPNLRAGRWVICDRFTDATYAYQGGGRGLQRGQHPRVGNHGARRTAPGSDAFARCAGGELALAARAATRNAGAAEPDRFESERAEFFERVRAAYLARAAAEPERIAVIDATSAGRRGRRAECSSCLEARSWIS